MPSEGAAALIVEPDDGADRILAIIRKARRSLHVEMYLLTDDTAVQALVESRQAGNDVQVILEPHPFQADGDNQAAYDRLGAAGVAVSWASPRFALTHAKLLIADGARACVMTLNLTRAGLTTNREYAIVDDDPTDVSRLETLFAADRVGASASVPSGRLLVSPGNARSELSALIEGARRSLQVEMEELSDAATVNALVAAAARAVSVTVVLPGTGRSALTSGAARRLADGGASVRVLASPTVHAKAMVADGARLYVGSANLTAGSLDHNREVGILLDDAATAGQVARAIDADWSRASEL
jgi:cardiolipin synthase